MWVIPYVRTEIVEKGGKKQQVKVDNISPSEIRKMSVKMPKILERTSDGIYVLDETSLMFKGTGLRMMLCFDYNELNEEEKIKYFDRSIVVPVVVKKPVSAKKRIKL